MIPGFVTLIHPDFPDFDVAPESVEFWTTQRGWEIRGEYVPAHEEQLDPQLPLSLQSDPSVTPVA